MDGLDALPVRFKEGHAIVAIEKMCPPGQCCLEVKRSRQKLGDQGGDPSTIHFASASSLRGTAHVPPVPLISLDAGEGKKDTGKDCREVRGIEEDSSEAGT